MVEFDEFFNLKKNRKRVHAQTYSYLRGVFSSPRLREKFRRRIEEEKFNLKGLSRAQIFKRLEVDKLPMPLRIVIAPKFLKSLSDVRELRSERLREDS